MPCSVRVRGLLCDYMLYLMNMLSDQKNNEHALFIILSPVYRVRGLLCDYLLYLMNILYLMCNFQCQFA